MIKKSKYYIFLFFLSFIIPLNAQVEKLETGFLQPEGPVWKDGVGVLFSDIRANKIYCWSPFDSSLTEFMYPSDSSNGLTFDLDSNLILTQMAKRRVSRREPDSSITPLAETYNGKRFNSPNDLVVKSDGSIFFTDPDFNTPIGQPKEMGFQGVFRIGKNGNIQVLDSTTFDKPNGICFSPDESKLYVNESPKRIIYVWDVADDSIITNKRVFFTIPGRDYIDYADGMKVDPEGNLYCTGPKGVWVISPDGICIDTILVPENPSNCNWGDEDRKTLYITAGSSLYRIRLPNGFIKDRSYIPAKSFELYQNYPNPFNPSTKIIYTVPSTETGIGVSMRIYDLLGCEVTTLMDGIEMPGEHSLEWNGTNSAGHKVGSGVYLYQLKSNNGYVNTRKMILLR
jgi:sugar lactone lactonase YvrE